MSPPRSYFGLVLLLGALGCPQDIATGDPLDAGAPLLDGALFDAGPPDGATRPDAGGFCGDDRVEHGEVCDGEDLAGRTCGDFGRAPGDLACNETCSDFIVSGCGDACAPECGARVCGPDPMCGASCGTCGSGEACDAAGACVPSCAPGSFACLQGGDAYQACGFTAGASVRDLGPPVTCAGAGGCDAAADVRCAPPACRPAELVVVLDRSAALAANSRWNVVVELLRERISARALAGRFALRELPSSGCSVASAPSLGQVDLGALSPPDGDGARPLAAALEGLETTLAGDAHGREVLLLLGGADTCEDEQVALQRVSSLHRDGVRVHVVLLVPSSPARSFLDRLAREGGTGAARVPGDNAELVAALDAVFAPLCENPVTEIDAGYYHACRRTPDAAVRCWGRDLSGESSVPPGRYAQVSAGTDFTCAVTTGGEIACWGRNQFGQTEAPARSDFVEVTAGNGHACGRRAGGEVVCWGRNEDGQGNPPPEVYEEIEAGYFFTCGLRTNGSVDCWGYGRPRFTEMGLSGLSAGGRHACALDGNARAVCHGSNGFGESSAPASSRFVHVAAGDNHTCGILETGEVECWGSDVFEESSPPPGVRFRRLSADNDYTCGVTADDTILCWGSGSNGQTTPPP